MAVGVPQETREYVQSIFAELLATRSQRELARELEINQSRVSTALNTGRLAPDTLWKAAKLAGRSEEDVRQHLRRTVKISMGRIERIDRSPTNPKPRLILTPAGVEEVARTLVPSWAPSADPRDALVAVFALRQWGYDAADKKTILRALALVASVHETMELAEEVTRLRWTLDNLRRAAAGDSPGDADVSDAPEPESTIDSPERG